MYDSSVVKHMIETTNDEGRNLTQWETDFMESITEQFEKHGRLSVNQVATLEKIYTARTN